VVRADVDPLDPATESEGFEAFYLREYHAVVRLAYALSGSRLAAEDIAQEAFLRAFRDWERIRHPSAWVRKVAHLADRLDASTRSCRVPSVYRRPGGDARARQRAWSVTRPCWWRWGDSNSRPAASFQGFSERSRRLRFGPGLSGGDAPGS
jgi:Sigma-70 region 2